MFQAIWHFLTDSTTVVSFSSISEITFGLNALTYFFEILPLRRTVLGDTIRDLDERIKDSWRLIKDWRTGDQGAREPIPSGGTTTIGQVTARFHVEQQYLLEDIKSIRRIRDRLVRREKLADSKRARIAGIVTVINSVGSLVLLLVAAFDSQAKMPNWTILLILSWLIAFPTYTYTRILHRSPRKQNNAPASDTQVPVGQDACHPDISEDALSGPRGS